jgi:hypothetical protein
MNLTEIIEELTKYMPDDEAHRLAAQLLHIGAQAAVLRLETAEAIADRIARKAAATARGRQH